MSRAPDFAAMFDALAESYDQSGVPFFGSIARGLVERLRPAPGERALDVGFGRGAATFPLAEAVGAGGRVDGIDIAAGMVRLTTLEAEQRGLAHVHLDQGDASDPLGAHHVDPASYDVVASSLVLFFLPDPAAALARWRGLLVPGGRLGFATFRPWPPVWRSVEDVFADLAEGDGSAATGMPDLFGADESVEDAVGAAGFEDVRTEGVTYPIPFDDVEQWRRWSHGTAMRGLWRSVPEAAHPEVIERVAAILAAHPGPDGRPSLDVDIRYTLARA